STKKPLCRPCSATSMAGAAPDRVCRTTAWTWPSATPGPAPWTGSKPSSAATTESPPSTHTHPPTGAPMIMNEIRPLTQQDVLEALDLLRPWATRRTPKVRVGNDYDGGYVLPAVALQCDVVLSIGV